METSNASIDGKSVVVRVQLDCYGLTPLQKACHKFTNRCCVHIESNGDTEAICRLTPQQDDEDKERLIGEFMNELLDQTLREQLAEQTEPIRRLLIAQAFSRVNLIHPELDQNNDLEETREQEQVGKDL